MLELYTLNTCPYCAKVIDYLDKNNYQYNVHDISSKKELNELKLIGGKEQVPYLFDPLNKIGLYESDTIIMYLDRLLKKKRTLE